MSEKPRYGTVGGEERLNALTEEHERLRAENAELAPMDKRGVPVYCTTCRRMKKPVGRSAALAAANGYCDDDCPGYRQEPHVGSLWPNERASEFGYPCSDVGTEPCEPAPEGERDGKGEA